MPITFQYKNWVDVTVTQLHPGYLVTTAYQGELDRQATFSTLDDVFAFLTTTYGG